MAPLVLATVQAGTMPPWPPGTGCNTYRDARTMEAGEIDALERWVEGGAPEGDPLRAQAPVEPEVVVLPRVDAELRPSVSYPPTLWPDDVRCFVLDWPSPDPETTFVTASRIVPGNPALVHHATAFLVPDDARDHYAALDAEDPEPGYSCFGETEGPSLGVLSVWTPGTTVSVLPEGVGQAVPPGSQVVLQVHYNTLAAEPAPDATALQVTLEPSVEKPSIVLGVFDPDWPTPGGMTIPAFAKGVTHRWSLDPRTLPGFEGAEALLIHRARLHMHYLGAAGTITLTRSDGTRECVLAIDDWDLDWQDAYLLEQPLRWTAGDTLDVECRYDNTADHQPTIDGRPRPPIDVEWGPGSLDEMCIGFLLVSL